MGTVITGRYIGDKKLEMTHELSGSKFLTDAPPDNNGKGEYFSPTDLCATSLGSCMLTVSVIAGERDGLDFTGSHLKIEKEMIPAPRRIGTIRVEFHLPQNFAEAARTKVEQIARSCPVTKSLHPNVKLEVSFVYDV